MCCWVANLTHRCQHLNWCCILCTVSAWVHQWGSVSALGARWASFLTRVISWYSVISWVPFWTERGGSEGADPRPPWKKEEIKHTLG